MSWLLIFLYYLNLHVRFSISVSINFADYQTSAFTIRQVCSSDGYADVCCEPFDLDVNDGRGYGWFRASRVVFTELESSDTTMTVFGKNPYGPCSDHVITSRQGSQAWQAAVPGRDGAGSASAVRSFRPPFMKRKFPTVIFLRGVDFTFTGWGTGEVAFYQDWIGNVIQGRKFGA